MLSKQRSRVNASFNTCLPPILELTDEQFGLELAKMRGSKLSFHPQPTVNGRIVSLVKLYNEVTQRGGSKIMSCLNLWDEVASEMNLAKGCINIGNALKNVFQNHLGLYERVQRSVDGQPCTDMPQIVDVDTPNLSSNLQAVANHLRHRWNLSCDLIESVEYRTLLLALESGLPNELDYAINSILLMSFQQNGFELGRCPQILPLLLSAVGIYSTGSHSYRSLKETWRSQCNRDFQCFWESVVHSGFGRLFLDPAILSRQRLPRHLPSNSSRHTGLTFRDTMTYSDVEGFRVQLVAMVLRNLVADDGYNSVLLSQEPDVLRFICLCIYSDHTALRQLGLDTLSFLHFPVIGPIAEVLERLLPELLCSKDRVDVSCGLRIIRHLCESPVQSHKGGLYTKHIFAVETAVRNADFLTSCCRLLSPQRDLLVDLVVQLVCLRDLHLLVLALDALFALSTQGPGLCDVLVRVDDEHSLSPVIPTLIGYLTFEAQSLGSEGLVRMKVMQVPGITASAAVPTGVHQQTIIATTNNNPSTVSRRPILERPIAPLTSMPPPSPGLTQLRRRAAEEPTDRAQSSLNKALLMGPLPRPHAGCYAVPVESCGVLAVGSATPVPTAFPGTPQSTMADISQSLPPAPATVVSMSSVCPTAAAAATTTTTTTTTTVVFQTTPNQKQHHSQQPRPPPLKPTPADAKQPPSTKLAPLNGKSLEPAKKPPPRNSHAFSSSAAPLTLSPASTVNSGAPTTTIYPDAPKDKWEFVVFWLNRNYEVNSQSSFSRVQIYTEYQKAHQAHFDSSSGGVGGGGGGVGALPAGNFHTIVKSVFPAVDQVKVLMPNGNVEIHYNKLKHVDAPEPVEQALGVQHMLGTCLAGQNLDGRNTAASKAPSTQLKSARKRSAVNLIDTAADHPLPPKQLRLLEDGSGLITTATTTNGSPTTSALNGSATYHQHHHPFKLVATNTFLDRLIPVSTNGPIEITSNGITLQQPIIAASAIVIPSLDGKRLINGLGASALNGGLGAPTLSCSTSCVSTTTTAPTTTIIDTSQVLQFRTLLPSTTTITNATTRPPQAPHQSRPSLVMQSAASVAPENATLTCLGTLVTAAGATGTTQQVIVYSLAPHQAQQLSIGGAASATLLPASVTLQPPPLAQAPPAAPLPPSLTIMSNTTATACSCLWAECRKAFPSADRLFSHVYSAHFTPLRGHQEVTCKWLNCKEVSVRRSPLSLLNHLHEQHCAARSPCSSSCLLASVTKSSPSSASATSAVPSEDPDGLIPLVTTKPAVAAMRASLAEREFHNSLLADVGSVTTTTTEGPVTKHVRLTSALILYNLATYSVAARRQLRPHESLLCELAFSGLEASSTLAKCLSILAPSPPLPSSPPRGDRDHDSAGC